MWLGKGKERETHCQRRKVPSACRARGPSLYLLWARPTEGCEVAGEMEEEEGCGGVNSLAKPSWTLKKHTEKRKHKT